MESFRSVPGQMWDQKYVVLKELIYLIRFPLLTKEEFNRHQGPVKYDLSCSHEKDPSTGSP